MDRKHRKRKISKMTDFMPDIPAAKNSVQIFIDGGREATLEGCSGVMAYDENIIILKSKNTDIKFTGDSLFLKSLNDENVIIMGKIISLEFIEKQG